MDAHDIQHLIEILTGWVNVILSVFIVYYSGRSCQGIWLKRPVCSLFAIIGVYWAFIYSINTMRAMGVVISWLPPTGSGPDTFGGIFVRPGFTITLAVMAIMSLSRFRRMKINTDGLDNTE